MAATVVLAPALAFELIGATDNQVVKLVVTLVAIGIAVAAWDRPHLGTFVVPALAVFDRPVQLLGFQVGLAVVALGAFAPAMARSWRQIPKPIAAGAALLLIGGTLACFFAADLPAAIGGLVTWALVLNYLFGTLGIVAARPGVLRGLAIELAMLGAIVAALGWLQSMGHYTVVGAPYVADRVDSTFGWYSNYGNFVAVAAVIGLGATISLAIERRITLAAFAGVCSVISAYGTFVSLSRGAVLCLGVGIAIVVIGRLRSFAVLLGSVVLIGLALLFAWWLTPPAILAEFLARFEDVQGGDYLRRILQQAGEVLLAQHPAGIGFGGFRALANSAFTVGTTVLAHCHELFIQIGLDDGWLGLAGFLLLVIFGAARGVLGAWMRRASQYGLGFAAALIGILAQGLNDYFFFETASTVVFGIALTGALAGYEAGEHPGAQLVEPQASQDGRVGAF